MTKKDAITLLRSLTNDSIMITQSGMIHVYSPWPNRVLVLMPNAIKIVKATIKDFTALKDTIFKAYTLKDFKKMTGEEYKAFLEVKHSRNIGR